jgi:proteasome accessory factor C
MDKFDRIFMLHGIFSGRKTVIGQEDLLARLECGRSTLYRIITEMRNRLGAPISYDSNRGGWCYAPTADSEIYELPGLWLSASELQALVVIQNLLRDLGGGLLQDTIALLARRIDHLIKHQRLHLGEVAHRLRFPALASRPPGEAFQVVAAATLQRKKLWFQYHGRSNDALSDRQVSPQRLTHYRESWYLDAWDEEKDLLRTFSVDRIVHPRVLEQGAYDVSEQELDEHFTTGYGIFGGKADKVAVLRFTKERARWVADERWHPQQQSQFLGDGCYELRVPYRDARELVMDILRHGPEVEVIEPESLRGEVAEQLARALGRYRS